MLRSNSDGYELGSERFRGLGGFMLVCDILRLLPPHKKYICLKVGCNKPIYFEVDKCPKEYLFSKVNYIDESPNIHILMLVIGFSDVIRNEQEYL